MAREQNLREYQQDILARLETAKNASASTSASYLGVVIGKKNVLVNLQEIKETLPIDEIQAVPLVKPWFLGVSNVRGVLYAVNDLAQMLEGTASQLSSSTRMLLLNEDIGSNVAFLVDRLIGLRRLDEMEQAKTTTKSSVCLKAETYQDAENRAWHVLDCDKLMHSRELATPYLI